MSMESNEMTVIEHLNELRKRIIIMLVSVTIATIVAYNKVIPLVKFLLLPLNKYKLDIVYFSMTEGFMTRLKLAVYVGCICTSPIIFYQTAAFINPGLTKKEKKLLYKSILFLFILFILGIGIGYVEILPYTLDFLITYSTSYLNPILSGNMYFSFIGTFCIITGIVFTIPFFCVILSKMGLLTSKNLRKWRKFIILGVAALELTFIPTVDILTYAIITIPIVILYEITIGLTYFIQRKRRKKEE